jgi:hypothetical protein
MRTLSVLAAGALLLSAMPAAAQQWAQLRDTLLEKAAEQFAVEGYQTFGFTHEGALDDGASERVALPLGAGAEIFLVGICDADCGDLDLTLYDPGGSQLDSDEELDDVPIVSAAPARAGRYSVRVEMAGCTVGPCRYALQLYMR